MAQGPKVSRASRCKNKETTNRMQKNGWVDGPKRSTRNANKNSSSSQHAMHALWWLAPLMHTSCIQRWMDKPRRRRRRRRRRRQAYFVTPQPTSSGIHARTLRRLYSSSASSTYCPSFFSTGRNLLKGP